MVGKSIYYSDIDIYVFQLNANKCVRDKGGLVAISLRAPSTILWPEERFGINAGYAEVQRETMNKTFCCFDLTRNKQREMAAQGLEQMCQFMQMTK